jgi:L-lactate dehydrogenase complex protein LldG
LSKILEILRAKNINEILVWDEKHLPDGLLEQLSQSGIQISHPKVDTVESLSHVQAGLTGSIAAIAETGSLLLLGGPGRPLTTSLLPEIHIALLWEKDIFDQLSQVLQLDEVKHAPASILVSGPSRTADIEMTLTIGVHGPGELYVICIQGN